MNDPLTRILTVFPQAISAMEIRDHREALRGYIAHYGFEAEEKEGTLLLREQGQVVLCAKFDDQRRLREVTGKLVSGQYSAISE